MPSSGGGPTLEVSQAGLTTVAATLTSTASSLAALAAAPPVHAPLAADEVSTSAAARLSEHGGVLSSRASDGAAVLGAAAQAVLAVSTQMAEIDAANATALALGAQGAAPVGGPATAATKVHAVAANTLITPMAPRPGELTAGLIETGSSSTGTTFQSGCRAYGSAFEACAVAARNAQSALAAGITGRTGPRLSTALSKFAAWADEMASHAESVAQSAQDHGGRFERTQHDTPRTQQFAVTRQSLNRAQMLNMQTGGMASGLVAQYASRLQQLDSTATAAGVSYHLTELPQAPPPPPRVTDIVDDNAAPSDGSGQPGEPESEESADPQDGAEQAGSASDADAAPDVLGGGDDLLAGDPLGAGDLGASPMGDPMQQIAPMAAMLPSAVAGALGGAMGAVTSVPQQVMSAAQQVMQGAAASMAEPDLGLDMDPLDAGLSDFGGGGIGSGGGGGGGGGVEPAGVDTSLPPGGGALAAASAPSGGPPVPSSSAAVSTPKATPTGAGGMGGMMMPPPMMGGMGAGGGGNADRTAPPPDKTVVIPSIPNGEPVKGEVERRQVASVNPPDQAKAETAEPASGRPRRRVVVSAPPDPDAKAK